MTDGPSQDLSLASAMPRPGDIIAERYRIDRVIGSGGMGVVLAGTHVELGHSVALKLLLPEVASSSGASERFLREARAAARLTSEHVVRITDTGRLPSGAPFMVMEHLQGRDLGDELAERGRIPVAEAVRYVLEGSDALVEAHSQGIVHRDLKPANLFLARRRDGSVRVKVLDFGISKVDGGTLLTSQDAVLGSPRYMSPEQLQDAHSVDKRADIWAIGVILYELVTGLPPFEGETLGALCTAILTKPFVPFERVAPEVPRAFAAIVARCLSKDPAGRFSDLHELGEALLPLAGSLRPPPPLTQGQDAFAPTIGDTTGARRARSTPPFAATTNAAAVSVSGSRLTQKSSRRTGYVVAAGVIAFLGLAGGAGALRWRAAHDTRVAPADVASSEPEATPAARPELAPLPPATEMSPLPSAVASPSLSVPVQKKTPPPKRTEPGAEKPPAADPKKTAPSSASAPGVSELDVRK